MELEEPLKEPRSASGAPCTKTIPRQHGKGQSSQSFGQQSPSCGSSVPFAVGSLSYSHSVNDIVRAWLITWNAAGGDMGRTPYLGAAPAGER